MSTYIDVEQVDMQKFAFEKIQGIDLPYWKDVTSVDDIVIKRISGAMTNIIFKVTLKDKICQPLLLRAYGNCTDVFFDRKLEIYYFRKLSDCGFGIELLKSFPGGRLEVWRDGFDAMLAPQMRTPEFSAKIAKKLAEMHNIELAPGDNDEYFKHFYSWAEGASNICKRGNLPKVRFDLLKQEVDSFVSLVKSDDYEVVFGHHDLQHGNILVNANRDIMFVDFEYSGRISVAVDIANHFCEWMTDYNLPDSHILRREWGPTDDQRKFFIRTYLEARRGREPTEEEIESLNVLVQKHEMLTDLHWFLWGLLQCELSDIDWDYWGYTVGRWNMYVDIKKRMYGADALPIMP